MPPIGPFDDFEECVRTMQDDRGHDQDSAESICGALEAESKADNGNPQQLMEALKQGGGLIADVGVDLVSGVDVPAVDSKWVMTKSGGARRGHDYRAVSPVLLSKSDDEEQRISYAAAMIPREPDKEGDVVATPTVESAAHDFLKQGGGVDTDHSLIDGEGEVVESWVLKTDREFDLPGGETESYEAGTWMVGIEWGADAWARIKQGDLTGLSIYGKAEHVPLEKAVGGDTHKGARGESGGMAPDDSGDSTTTDAGDGTTDSAKRIEEVAASVNDLSQTVASIKDAVEKQDPQEAAADLGDEYDLPPGDVLDILNAAATHDASDVLEAIDSLDEGGDEMEESVEDEAKEDDEDGDEEEKATAEKRASDANLEKGGDATGTAAKAHEESSGETGLPSYQAAAEQHTESD